MTAHYAPKQAASLLSISVSTLRRIADEFAEHLPDYQPRPGERRTFTDADLRTIYAIQSRLQDQPGQTRAALLAEMSEPDSEPLIIPATLPTDIPATAQDAPERPKASRDIQTTTPLPESAIERFLSARNETDRKIDALSVEIERLSADRPGTGQPSPARYAVAIIACFVLLLVGVVVSTFAQDARPALVCSVLALTVIGITLIWPTVRR